MILEKQANQSEQALTRLLLVAIPKIQQLNCQFLFKEEFFLKVN
jgi:hypothetical protein